MMDSFGWNHKSLYKQNYPNGEILFYIDMFNGISVYNEQRVSIHVMISMIVSTKNQNALH